MPGGGDFLVFSTRGLEKLSPGWGIVTSQIDTCITARRECACIEIKTPHCKNSPEDNDLRPGMLS